MAQDIEHDLRSLEDVFHDYLLSFGIQLAGDTQRKLLKEIFDSKEAFEPVCALQYKGTIIIAPRQTLDDVKTLAFLDVHQNQVNYLSLT